jgi:diguanylate cyclase (GGDEF)-like protein
VTEGRRRQGLPGRLALRSFSALSVGSALVLLALGVIVHGLDADRTGVLPVVRAAAVTSLLAGGLLSLVESQRVTRSLSDLAAHAKRLAEWIAADRSELDPFPVAAGEVGELARSCNQMVASLAENVRRRQRAEARLSWDALHDPLTGLPNRALFLDRLRRNFNRMKRDHASAFAVLVLELDRLPEISERYGLGASDQLLVAVVRRLEPLLRHNDSLCRLGSHELGVLMDDARRSSDPIMLGRRLLDSLEEPFVLDGVTIGCSCSVGIAVSLEAMAAAEELLQAAAVAARRAAARGGHAYELSDPDLHDRTLDLIELHQDLRVALRKGQIGVRFQPIVRLADGAVCSLEALATWEHPQRGSVDAHRFITLAEQTGLIPALGREVLRLACERLSRHHPWRDGGWKEVSLSYNVSGRQLSRADLVDDILAVLAQHGISPARLTVEITEGALVDEPAAAMAVVRSLQEKGVRFHIDDFGTGYASMTYLQRFPCHAIKLDRSFVSTMAEEPSSLAIVRAGIALAHQLGKGVIAEGVETGAQLELLRELGCDYAQGFVFGGAQAEPEAAFDGAATYAAAPLGPGGC